MDRGVKVKLTVFLVVLAAVVMIGVSVSGAQLTSQQSDNNQDEHGEVCVYKEELGVGPIEGVIIYLYLWEGEDWSVDPVRTDHTDANGTVCFEGLELGRYLVGEEIDEGWYTDSEWQEVEINASEPQAYVTFTNIQYGKICGYKFFDENLDGVFDIGDDNAIAGWEIELRVWNAPTKVWEFVAANHTDENGYYCFGNLVLGTYNVTEVMRECWVNITPSYQVVVGDTSGFEFEEVNFGNVICRPPGHTIGFWKTNIIKNVNDWERGTQVSMDDLKRFIFAIDEAYGEEEGLEWLNLTEADSWENVTKEELSGAYAILSIPNPSNMTMKAQAQILSLLLTAEMYEPCYREAMVQLPHAGDGGWEGSIGAAISHILDLYLDGEYETAKDLADFVNNLPPSCPPLNC